MLNVIEAKERPEIIGIRENSPLRNGEEWCGR